MRYLQNVHKSHIQKYSDYGDGTYEMTDSFRSQLRLLIVKLPIIDLFQLLKEISEYNTANDYDSHINLSEFSYELINRDNELIDYFIIEHVNGDHLKRLWNKNSLPLQHKCLEKNINFLSESELCDILNEKHVASRQLKQTILINWDLSHNPTIYNFVISNIDSINISALEKNKGIEISLFNFLEDLTPSYQIKMLLWRVSKKAFKIIFENKDDVREAYCDHWMSSTYLFSKLNPNSNESQYDINWIDSTLDKWCKEDNPAYWIKELKALIIKIALICARDVYSVNNETLAEYLSAHKEIEVRKAYYEIFCPDDLSNNSYQHIIIKKITDYYMNDKWQFVNTLRNNVYMREEMEALCKNKELPKELINDYKLYDNYKENDSFNLLTNISVKINAMESILYWVIGVCIGLAAFNLLKRLISWASN